MDKATEKVYQDIKSIKIQGATNVALAVAAALKSLAVAKKWKSGAEFVREIVATGNYLANARATEPMAGNVVEFVQFYLRKNAKVAVVELKEILNNKINGFFALIEGNDDLINKYGERLIKNNDRLFTHCHASTVMNILRAARRNKKRFQVFQTETRPLFQGHKTAKELFKNKINDTLIIDSAAPFLMSSISGKAFSIDKVIIGCDAVARDGSCVNKVGSFGIAQSAFLNKIPVYIATQALKMNEDARDLAAIKIEKRPAKEVWAKAPNGLKIYNPAFDRVPAKYITGYICEFGVLKPSELLREVKNNYPWLWT